MFDGSTYQQDFGVPFAYPVHFCRDLLDEANPLLVETLDRDRPAGGSRCLAFVDAGLAAHHPKWSGRLAAYCARHAGRLELVAPPRVVVGGEAIKNDYRLTMEIVDTILEYRLCRHSYVLVAGGGAVLDAVGFAASIVHRGLRLVRIPSTVLAQNDAGIGVKNGMNLHGGKNTIGTFCPPFAVFNDALLLETLSDTDWAGGISEAFKVAMIKDRDFFAYLCERADALRGRDLDAMAELVRRCAILHLEHIRSHGDPFELGRARPLDFGHWAAHKLELMSNHEIGHGQAVAAGIALDTLYAEKQGWLSADERKAVHTGLVRCGLPLWYPQMRQRHADGKLILLDGLEEFREHLGGQLCVTFPEGIGNSREVDEIETGLVEEALAGLESMAGQPHSLS